MFTLANHQYTSRLLTGTGKFSSVDSMERTLVASNSNIVTLAMKRISNNSEGDSTDRKSTR